VVELSGFEGESTEHFRGDQPQRGSEDFGDFLSGARDRWEVDRFLVLLFSSFGDERSGRWLLLFFPLSLVEGCPVGKVVRL